MPGTHRRPAPLVTYRWGCRSLCLPGSASPETSRCTNIQYVLGPRRTDRIVIRTKARVTVQAAFLGDLESIEIGLRGGGVTVCGRSRLVMSALAFWENVGLKRFAEPPSAVGNSFVERSPAGPTGQADLCR